MKVLALLFIKQQNKRTREMSKPKVIVNIDKTGNIEVAFCGEVSVYWIDENAPNDKVFMSSNQVSEREIVTALGTSVIGHTGDSSDAETGILNYLSMGGKTLN